jgi:YidC/Oxa1 family membrane protein insertase
MERNQIIGLVLIAGILLVYSIFFAPDAPPPAPKTIAKDSTLTKKTLPGSELAMDSDTSMVLRDTSLANTKPEEQFVVVTNKATYTFTTFGGKLLQVELNGFKTFDKKPLKLIEPNTSDYRVELPTRKGWFDIQALQYSYTLESKKIGDTTYKIVTFTGADAEGRAVEQQYSIPENSHVVDYTIRTRNMAGNLTANTIQVVWNTNLPQLEKDIKASRVNSTVNVYTQEPSLLNLGESTLGLSVDSTQTPLHWVSHKHKFFTVALIAGTPFTGVRMTSRTDESDPKNVKFLGSVLTADASKLEEEGVQFRHYYGPNDYKIMEGLAPGFEENVYLGWTIFGTINRYTIMPLFRFLEQFISSYGVIIIILLIIVKIILSPLSYRSYVSMAKMRLLKPELDELKAKYGDDLTGMQAEQMQIYQKAGVNPLSGCVPVLLQMPIFLALFNFFPNAIELRQEGFLWADDLSSYDSIVNLPFTIPFYGAHVSLFTLLMTASTLVYTWYNNQMNPSAAVGPMKTISYIMPITFLFFLNSFASGLTLYYFVSNVVTIGQQMLIARFVDEEKLRKVLEENKKRNVNKPASRMQQRMQEALKAKETPKTIAKTPAKGAVKPASKPSTKKPGSKGGSKDRTAK